MIAARPIPAAALVLHHHEAPAIRLVPITVFDFYARAHDLSDLHKLGREEYAAGHPQGGPVHVLAGSALAVPAAGADLREVQGSAGGRRRGAGGVARKEGR